MQYRLREHIHCCQMFLLFVCFSPCCIWVSVSSTLRCGVMLLQLVCSLFLWFVSIQTRFIRCRVFYIFLLFWNNRKSSIFSPLQHRHRYQHSIDINSMVNKIIITKRKNWNTEKKEEKTYFSAVKTKHTCQALSFILIVLPFFALLLATSIFIHK